MSSEMSFSGKRVDVVLTNGQVVCGVCNGIDGNGNVMLRTANTDVDGSKQEFEWLLVRGGHVLFIGTC